MKLEQNLGYSFKDKTLLQTALRHRSMGAGSNERFEFLGDSVLGFIITQELFKRFGGLREGELSRLRASLVRKESLAEISRELDVGKFLLLGSGERKSGGHRRDSILADALEAIIAAIYLDSDLATCQDLVLHWYQSEWKNLHASAQKDPKSRLQEFAQSKQLPLPEYEVTAITGDEHEQIFSILCTIDNLDITATGSGLSKQVAEQEAATKFLEQLKYLKS